MFPFEFSEPLVGLAASPARRRGSWRAGRRRCGSSAATYECWQLFPDRGRPEFLVILDAFDIGMGRK